MRIQNSIFNSNIKNAYSLYIFFVAFAFFFVPFILSAATISISPSSGNYNVGQTFTATVQIQPSGSEVNAVEAQLSFDNSALEVVSVSKDNSAFSLWTTEPAFSNQNGTITFGGGSPTPFTTPSTAVTVTFRATGESVGTVSFDDVSILIADGRGTDAFGGSTGGTYNLAQATTPDPTPTPTPTPVEEEDEEETLTFGDPPRAPEIGSQTFIDRDEWYRNTEGLFSWSLPFDVNAVAIDISSSADNVPYEDEGNIFDPPIEEFQLTSDNLIDGVQYLSIAYRNQVGWGSVLNRKIQIDTTAPEKFEIEVIPGRSEDSFPTLRFEAVDNVSGIDYYELYVADREPVIVSPDEARLGYLLGSLEDGTYTVEIVAFDRAGNSTESSTPVIITAGWQPELEKEEDWSIWNLFTGTNIIIIILLIIIGLLSVYTWYEQKWAKQREDKLRRETREIQDQMEKIFSALRDEIYDQVNTITKRKRLSTKEREAVESINQALEVSETLIEKEINDVKSILK